MRIPGSMVIFQYPEWGLLFYVAGWHVGIHGCNSHDAKQSWHRDAGLLACDGYTRMTRVWKYMDDPGALSSVLRILCTGLSVNFQMEIESLVINEIGGMKG